MDFKLAQHGPFLVLGGIVLALVVVLLHKNKDRHSRINLEDLLLDPDTVKLAPSRCVLAGSFLLTSWGMLFMWLNDKMTEGYFGAYLAAWVAPAVAVVIKGRSPVAAPDPPAPTPPK